MECNLRDDLSWTESKPEDLELKSGTLRGGHKAGDPPNHFSTAATFCTREIPSWGLFRRPAGEGINHGGLLHQHHSLR